jgi:putative nucleotidyltransferase with HDIG domain
MINQFAGERILVVDDLASMRDMICAMLAGEGYKDTEVADGYTALARLHENKFALVLLDITMPGKSGIQLLREIVTEFPDTAVVMLTAVDDAETAIELLKIGAYDYLIKPVQRSMLAARVERALERRKLLVENRNYKIHLEEKVKEQAKKIHESFLNSLTSLARALEAKDKYTSGHSMRVASRAVEIAKELGLTSEQIEKIRVAGLLHDIGKIGIAEAVLNKQEQLSDNEYLHLVSHSVIGESILRPIVDDQEILSLIRHHHERYDGCGYPDRLSAQNIPQGARILAIADAYDALTSDRPYRKASNRQLALTELVRNAGSQFDPTVVDIFLQIMNRTEKQSRREQAVTA